VLSSDGKLPGGLTPEQLKKLVSNPELMAMLQSVRMQEVMKLMMTSGPEALQKAMEEDEETKQLVMKLNEVMMKTV
jgi:CHASE3 domain sensor protein